MLYLENGGVEMERSGEKAKTEESTRGSVGATRRFGTERGQKARQQTKRSKGWSGQKPQENFGCQAQCAPATAWTPQESLNFPV
jgi:hypothetical protein